MTLAYMDAGKVLLGNQKCVCVLPCSDDDCKAVDADATKGTFRCKGSCCGDYYENITDKDHITLRCTLVVDHSEGDKLKCVCIWITKPELEKEKAEREKTEKEEKEQKQKDDEIEKLKKELEKLKQQK